eukprot:TRINITY_DN6083_c0_g1_i2.p1 TRINITY_DN6083_c0_g1~~TRINITY_DN6083_c0_g1_i2.p1  ORF type:complete len:1954 (+),score=684.67 TRINITY_DN6083_c0_g1_i2:86-5863(+)
MKKQIWADLDSTQFSSVEEYVSKLGDGIKKPIHTVLIANNGIAAVKCIRSVRKWAYHTFGDERKIQFVVMATPEDLKINAEYIRMADQVEEVPGGPNVNNYANVDLIIDIAERRMVDAVWAGWGHASENPRLPDLLARTKSGTVFIGPPARAMQDLGDKIASILVAQSAGVSCAPWSGSGLTLDYANGGIPEETYAKSCVNTIEEAAVAMAHIGYPAMIKASEGGGGKGIRKVTRAEEFEAAFRQVQSEVPGSPIFIMKMLGGCRHLEVQIVGDQYGQAIALYGRDCSVQRRHQKIIEEGPPIAAPLDVWYEMEKAAVRMAKTVGYVGAGTIEYLFDERTSQYYFLELNPRLQVEHPVTEQITSVNLPAVQLNVAMGVPLHRIPDIRRLYHELPYGTEPIDLDNTPRVAPKGHCIAVRITGENPDEGFKPTSGGIQELNFRSSTNVWGYFSVGAMGGLHEYADSQFGHVFARGRTREQARRELVLALKDLSIRGDISNARAFLLQLLETDVFKNNKYTTEWLDGLIAAKVSAKKLDPWLVVICGALYTAHTTATRRYKEYITYLERGQIPPRELLAIKQSADLIYEDVKYCVSTTRSGPTSFVVFLDNADEANRSSVEAEVRPLGDGGLLVLVDGRSHVCYGTDTVSGLKLIVDGQTCLFTTEYDPAQLRTPTTGKLVRYLVEAGSHVQAGQAYAEMEVMKMYLPLLVTETGKIHFVRSEGSVLELGDVVARLELDDPSKVRRAATYTGKLPAMKSPHVKSDKPHEQVREAVLAIQRAQAGYHCSQLEATLDDLLHSLRDYHVPLLEFQECLSRIGMKLPKDVARRITDELDLYKSAASQERVIGGLVDSTMVRIKSMLDKYMQEQLSPPKHKEFLNLVAPLIDLCRKYEGGLDKMRQDLFSSFLKHFLEVESRYLDSRESVISRFRQEHKNDLKKVYELELAHFSGLQTKLILTILDKINSSDDGIRPYIYLLHDLADLPDIDQLREVARKGRHMLTIFQLPTFEQRKTLIEQALRTKPLDLLLREPAAIFDVLTALFEHPNSSLRQSALEVYVHRTYRAYTVTDFKATDAGGILRADWNFVLADQWASSTPENRRSAALRESMSDPAPELRKSGSISPVLPSPRTFAAVKRAALPRVYTDNDLASLDARASDSGSEEGDKPRYAMMAFFPTEAEFFARFEEALDKYFRPASTGKSRIERSVSALDGVPQPEMRDVVAIALQIAEDSPFLEDSSAITTTQGFLRQYLQKLRILGIRRVTLITIKPGRFPRFYSFRERLDYAEDPIYRNVEPPLAYHLELRRLFTSNYNIQFVPTENPQVHLYVAEEKGASGEKHSCLFARAMVRGGHMFATSTLTDYLVNEAETVLMWCLNVMELAMGNAKFKGTWNNQIFLKFIPEVVFDPENVEHLITELGNKYKRKLQKLRVGQVEFVAKLKNPNSVAKPTTVRFFASNFTGFKYNADAYVEVKDVKSRKIVLVGGGPLDGKETNEPYPQPTAVMKKRVSAHQQLTSYVYDYPEILEVALQNAWRRYYRDRGDTNRAPPKDVLIATEVMLENGKLVDTVRPAGQNTVGMVAWRCTAYTPEYPKGRPLYVIANDITYQIGSFGPMEDELFNKVSQRARADGVPRVYIAANSGARIGLASEVKDKFRVEWLDETDLNKGFKYLYLNDEEYANLSRLGSVIGQKVAPDRWQITDVVGVQDGLGVENLKGSGMIAGETSRAYAETFTVTLVTGRTVGIGAYLVRLGQRTIQTKGPIILTGAPALNKVLGSKVYSSNTQLGGTQVMYHNGVTHQVVHDDLDGVAAIVNWLAYVPARRDEPLPLLDLLDPIDRTIDFEPSSLYDPRHMLAGYNDPARGWVSGFFDRDSFTESLGGWGKTVVCGRARLGGIPMGVIAVETRTMECVLPADPASRDSTETVLLQVNGTL